MNKIHTKAYKRAKVICFFAVLKPMPGNIYEIALECTVPQKVNDRLNQWKSDNYIALSPKCTGDFDSYEKQEYSIIFSGNIKMQFGTTKLQFHSKRKNSFQTLCICIANKDEPANGSLDVIEMPEEEKLTSIMLWLSNITAKNPTPKKEDSFTGITCLTSVKTDKYVESFMIFGIKKIIKM